MSEPICAASLRDRYAAGERDFRSLVFEDHMDLSGTSLDGADFTDSHLPSVILDGASLVDTCFRHARTRR